MRRFHELRENPVSVTLRDRHEDTYTVQVMRLREGITKITCQCQRYSENGWCHHCLALFSDKEIFESKQQREAFEELVGGTYLEKAAAKLIRGLDGFAVAYRQMKAVRPSDLNPKQLRDFSKGADHASATALSLVQALEVFIKEAAAKHEEVRPGSIDAVGSESKESAVEMVRRISRKRLKRGLADHQQGVLRLLCGLRKAPAQR
jgi:hypothetical protein